MVSHLSVSYSVMRFNLGILFFLLVLSVLVTVFLSRSISKPILKLRDMAIELAKGKLDTRIEINSKDEIGELARSFNAMAHDLGAHIAQLEKAKAELKDWSESLERRIESRTRDLAYAQETMLHAIEELNEAKIYVESIIANVADALLVLNLDGTIHTVNEVALTLSGYRQEELIGKQVSITLADPEMAEDIVNKIREEGELKDYEVTCRSKDGRLATMLISGSLMTGKDVKTGGIVIIAKDITERKHMEERLHSLSVTDELTGLFNRRGFFTLAEQQLKIASRARREMVLLYADLDKLKWINDTLGHPEGDRALSETAKIFKKTFRDSDIIARIGGDEFVVLAIETREVNAEVLITHVQENVEAYNVKGTSPYRLSLSIGTARFDPYSPCTIDELLTPADTMMYEQKRKKYGLSA